MAKYILKPSTPTAFFIRYRGKNIGHITRKATDTRVWVAKIDSLTEYGSDAKDAFEKIVAARNRIDLCGENDPVKARAALDKRNAQAEQEARAFAPVLDIARQLGLPVPRRRGRRILI